MGHRIRDCPQLLRNVSQGSGQLAAPIQVTCNIAGTGNRGRANGDWVARISSTMLLVFDISSRQKQTLDLFIIENSLSYRNGANWVRFFDEAMSIHKERFFWGQRIDKWKTTLRVAANLSG